MAKNSTVESTESKARGPRRNVAMQGMDLPRAVRSVGAIGTQLAIVGGVSGKADYLKCAQLCKALFEAMSALK